MMVCMLYKIYSAYPSQQSMALGMIGRCGKIEEASVVQAVPEAIQGGQYNVIMSRRIIYERKT